MLGRQRETIKARTSMSVPFKGIWMRAYPIIGCLHPSCYHRGQGYPVEIPINSAGKQQRGVGLQGRGRVGECVFWTGRPCLYFKISLTVQQVHQIGRFTFQAPADHIGLHQMQQFHRQLKGEASLALSWWSSQVKHQHKHNQVEKIFFWFRSSITELWGSMYLLWQLFYK